MSKYFHIAESRTIDEKTDVCSLDEWRAGKKNSACALSEKGFYVFVEADKLDFSDEYAKDDPYSVSDNITSAFHQRRFRITTELIEKYATSGTARILDLGCGEGHLTQEIKEMSEDYDVYGLDYSITAIDYAVKEFPGIDFIVADAFKPPYEDEFFDVVVCNNIWEHVPDPLLLLKGISRILKPGGLVVISTPSRYRFGNVLRILVGIGTKFVSKLHVTEYSVGQVQEQLKYGGYTVLDAYSPVIKEKNLFFTLLKGAMSLALKIIRSKHVLEATVFYAARKDTAE